MKTSIFGILVIIAGMGAALVVLKDPARQHPVRVYVPGIEAVAVR